MAKKKSSGSPSQGFVEEPSGSVFDPLRHVLVPTHEKLAEKEATAVKERFHASLLELPKISITDPGLHGLKVKQGDIIKIVRKSHTAGEAVFYRGVIDG